MRKYSVSKLAESDLKAIARHTLKTYGHAESKRYLRGLRDCFQLLSEDSTVGRRWESIFPGLRRIEYCKHVVSYVSSAEGEIIARVLPKQMVPVRLSSEP